MIMRNGRGCWLGVTAVDPFDSRRTLYSHSTKVCTMIVRLTRWDQRCRREVLLEPRRLFSVVPEACACGSVVGEWQCQWQKKAGRLTAPEALNALCPIGLLDEIYHFQGISRTHHHGRLLVRTDQMRNENVWHGA